MKFILVIAGARTNRTNREKARKAEKAAVRARESQKLAAANATPRREKEGANAASLSPTQLRFFHRYFNFKVFKVRNIKIKLYFMVQEMKVIFKKIMQLVPWK